MKAYSFNMIVMEDEHLNKPRLDDLFEKTRNAEPVMSIHEVASLVNVKGNHAARLKSRKAPGKNLLRGLISVGFIFLIFIAFLLSRKEPAIQKENNTAPSNEIISAKDEAVVNNNTIETNEKKSPESQFPPVYKEENISRPFTENEKPKEEKTTLVSEKTRTKTDGAATISFIHDDKNIKIVLYFSEVKELFIDGLEIRHDDFAAYAGVIEAGRKLEKESRKEKEEKAGLSEIEREQKRNNEVVMNTLIKVLARDGLIKDQQPFDFRLQWNKLSIDGRLQPDEVYEKYKALYEESSGKLLNENSNVHIKH